MKHNNFNKSFVNENVSKTTTTKKADYFIEECLFAYLYPLQLDIV